MQNVATEEEKTAGPKPAQIPPPGWTLQPIGERGDSSVLPEFGRWQDVQRLFGIKRGVLYRLMNEGVVRSVSLRRLGQRHSVRLFFLPSVRAYLHGLLANQETDKD